MFNFVRRILKRRKQKHPPTLADVTDVIVCVLNDLYQNQHYIVIANYEQNAVDVYDVDDLQPNVRLYYTEIMSYRHSVHGFLVYLKSKVKEKL